jgi:glutamate carboxypeptidase
VNAYAPYVGWIDEQRDVMRRRVTDWANVNSGTGNLTGLERLAADIRREFAGLNGVIEEHPLRPAESVGDGGEVVRVPLGSAIRIRKRPHVALRVFLGIHLDTVYPPGHPFQAVRQLDGNTLRGPGVLDAKGGLAVMLTALEALERSPFATGIGWDVLLNPDEEIGSVGSAPLLARAAGDNHVGLVFEPALAGGALADRRRGVGNFTVVVRGRAAHAGRDFEHGRNAVVAAAELAVALHALNGATPGVTVNVGRLEGGGPANVVPELAVCRLNVRTSLPADEDVIRRELERILASIAHRDGITVELHGGFTSPPKIPDGPTRTLMSHVTACGNDLGLPIEWRASGGACDGNKLAAAGLPTVDSLGPRGGDMHSPTEYLLIDSLTERAKLAALLLMKLASGEIPWPPNVEYGSDPP